jgi:hypothetical protein
MSEPYDSTADTNEHISRVCDALARVRENLAARASRHDLMGGQLSTPEKMRKFILGFH